MYLNRVLIQEPVYGGCWEDLGDPHLPPKLEGWRAPTIFGMSFRDNIRSFVRNTWSWLRIDSALRGAARGSVGGLGAAGAARTVSRL